MTNFLTKVTLLLLYRPFRRTVCGFMAGFFAVIAESHTRVAIVSVMTKVSTLITRPLEDNRHRQPRYTTFHFF
jgi:hypothetical protein